MGKSLVIQLLLLSVFLEEFRFCFGLLYHLKQLVYDLFCFLFVFKYKCQEKRKEK